jgi:hypothetical protein
MQLENVCRPMFKPGDTITGHATAAVVGKTFADISGDIQEGPDITTVNLPSTWDSGNIQVAGCAAGKRPIGVFGYSQEAGEPVPLLCAPGYILPLTAGAAIVAGEEVQVGAASKPIPVAAGAAADASLVTGVVANNNAILYTAKAGGYAGNDITVQLHNPAAASQALAVVVTEEAIEVNLATGAGSEITSTAALVIAAINASAAASALITAANDGASTGAGVVLAVAATPLSGGVDPVTGKAAGKAVTSAEAGEDVYIRLY